jgi:hypothetical protein
MLQKSQWSLAATALAVGACLMTAARPAHAQVRIHLTGPVKTTPGTGIILPSGTPKSTPVNTVPAPSPIVTKPASTPVVTKPAPTPVVTTPAPVTTTISTPKPTPAPITTTKPVVNSAPQGFSAGPGLLGDNRINLSYMVNRVGPDIVGVGGPSVQKVHAHH